MKKTTFIFLLCIGCSSTPSSNPETSAPVHVIKGDRIEPFVSESFATQALPGLGVRVNVGGLPLYSVVKGKRAIQHENAATVKDVWHLGSNTKAMTAFLIALAIQDGRLEYSSNVINMLDINTKVHPGSQNLMVTDLLSHGSALKDVQHIQDGKLWKEVFKTKKPLAEQRLQMSAAAFEEPPLLNRSFNYANINYIVLGALLEKIYQKSWEELLLKNLFEPLKMTSCGFGPAGESDETIPSQPWPHMVEKDVLVGMPPKFKVDNPPMLGPAGTVHCSLEDYQKFIDELINAFNEKGTLLKNKEVIKTYFSNAKDSPYTFGGWGRRDENGYSVFQHAGSNTFNYAIAWFVPQKKMSIILTTNSGKSEAEDAIQKLKKHLALLLLAGAK